MRFPLLLRYGNYDLRISADFDVTDDEAPEPDACDRIAMADATGLVTRDSDWDGLVCVEVELRDLGFDRHFVQTLEPYLQNYDDCVLLTEALLRHRIPFYRWATVFDPAVWSRATSSGRERQLDVGLVDDALVFHFHATRIARSFQQELAQAAAEGE